MNRQTYDIIRKLACFDLEPDQAAELCEALKGFGTWPKLQSGLELHAMAPLAYGHFHKHDLACPPSFMLGLKALALRHRTASRIRYQVLSELLRELEKRDIPMLGIKGNF